MSRFRRISARRVPRSRSALYREARRAHRATAAPRRRARRPIATCHTRWPSTSRSSPGSSISSARISRRLPRHHADAVAARPAQRRVAGARGRARRRAARALPSRLSQPQPDAARRPPAHHRLPGRADGSGHLRPGVAAARLVCRSDGRSARRADRLLSRAKANVGDAAARRVQAPVRSDGGSAQPEGARHVRLSDHQPAQSRPTFNTCPRTLGYVRRNLAKYPRFARLRELLASQIEELR